MSTEEDILQEVANNSGYGIQQVLTGTGQSLFNAPAAAPQTNYLTPPTLAEMEKYARMASFSGYAAQIVRSINNVKYSWLYPGPFYQGAMSVSQILANIKKGKWVKV